MTLQDLLRAAGVLLFPCWTRYNATAGKWDKGPAVPRGVSWRDVAQHSHLLPLDWSSGIVGVLVPRYVVIFDADLYRNPAVREQAEQLFGCTLPWDAAHVQATISGGAHYAFRCDWECIQGDTIGGIVGFDTRTDKGFICSGQGYVQNAFGVAMLGYPDMLPELPDACRTVLERKPNATPKQQPTAAETTTDTQQIRDALCHIDPGCSRSEWVRIGCALRNHYRDDPDGESLFDEWSRGDLWSGEPPSNYVAEHIPHQWGSFKPDGDVTVATLYHYAVQAGWRPPVQSVDTALAFGPGAAPPDRYAELVARIRADGCDVAQVPAIVDAIRAAGCNPLQVALLASELKTELPRDKVVGRHIDKLLAPPTPPRVDGRYSNSDPHNAALLLRKFWPDDTLMVCDGEPYIYNGRAWGRVKEETLKHIATLDMSAEDVQEARVMSAVRTALRLSPTADGGMSRLPPHLIVFNNGVLDTDTGVLSAHDKKHLNTIVLPYDYVPGALCPQWSAFVHAVFDGDADCIALLQEWFGYMMINDYSYQKAMFLLGAPRSGKGTIGRVLERLVGVENFTGGSLSSFARDSFIDSLRAKPVMFIGDVQKKVSGNIINEVIERVKQITGNDAVDFHRMYYGTLSTTLPTRVTLAGNSVPGLFDDSGALASRLLLLPFNNSFLGREDLTLFDRLTGELSGIAAWALEGLRRLRANGRFTEPAASRAELEYIREAYSPLTRFVSNCCRRDGDARCTAKDLYDVYRAWGLQEGESLLCRRTFVGAVKDALRGQGVRYGVHWFDGGAARGFTGIQPNDGAATITSAAFAPKAV